MLGTGAEKFANGIGKVWSRAYALLANYAGRIAQTEVEPQLPAVLTGTVTRSDELRLFQDAISSRVLEALLGLIAVCIALSFWTMNTREILPKNPCSIGAAASLLAGSNMLREHIIPRGSEWCSSKAMAGSQRALFDGHFFSMGWWDRSDGVEFAIDVGKARWSP